MKKYESKIIATLKKHLKWPENKINAALQLLEITDGAADIFRTVLAQTNIGLSDEQLTLKALFHVHQTYWYLKSPKNICKSLDNLDSKGIEERSDIPNKPLPNNNRDFANKLTATLELFGSCEPRKREGNFSMVAIPGAFFRRIVTRVKRVAEGLRSGKIKCEYIALLTGARDASDRSDKQYMDEVDYPNKDEMKTEYDIMVAVANKYLKEFNIPIIHVNAPKTININRKEMRPNTYDTAFHLAKTLEADYPEAKITSIGVMTEQPNHITQECQITLGLKDGLKIPGKLPTNIEMLGGGNFSLNDTKNMRLAVSGVGGALYWKATSEIPQKLLKLDSQSISVASKGGFTPPQPVVALKLDPKNEGDAKLNCD